MSASAPVLASGTSDVPAVPHIGSPLSGIGPDSIKRIALQSRHLTDREAKTIRDKFGDSVSPDDIRIAYDAGASGTNLRGYVVGKSLPTIEFFPTDVGEIPHDLFHETTHVWQNLTGNKFTAKVPGYTYSKEEENPALFTALGEDQQAEMMQNGVAGTQAFIRSHPAARPAQGDTAFLDSVRERFQKQTGQSDQQARKQARDKAAFSVIDNSTGGPQFKQGTTENLLQPKLNGNDVDYAALAQQHGGMPVVDIEALAKKFGGIRSSGPTTPSGPSAAQSSDPAAGSQPAAAPPVHHGTNDVEQLRASAERQAPKIGDAVSSAVASVPGAKLEAVRDSKDSDRIADKAARQEIQPSQIADIAAAKVTVPDQSSADKVLANLHPSMPVESVEGSVNGDPGKNAVRQTQAVVSTNAPSHEPVKKAEVILQTPEMHKATDETHDDYRKAQELRAAGKEAEARQLESQIQREHEAAEQTAQSRQEKSNAKGSDTTQEKTTTSAAASNDGPAPGTQATGEKEKARDPRLAPIPPVARRTNEGKGAQTASASPAGPVPEKPTPAENQPVGVQASGDRSRADFEAIKARLPELEAKLNTSARAPRPPVDTLRDQQVQVRDGNGDWRKGKVLYDNANELTGGNSGARRLRGTFEDGTKFNNVKMDDVRKRDGAPDIGVDFDGTLFTESGTGEIGKPIPARIESVKKMLAEGKSVEIITRRVEGRPEEVKKVQDALEAAGLPRLPVTDRKSAQVLFDNNAHHAPTNANTPLTKSNNARKS